MLHSLSCRNLATGADELTIEGLSVGFGARPHADGIDAVYYVAQENYPVEFAEMECAVEIEAFRIHRDSGGAGFHRGGAGIVRDVRVLSDVADLGLRIDNCRFPAFGANGGLAGRPGRLIVNPGGPGERELKPMSDGNRVKKGDLIRVITPGGGGWGNPLERPAARVLEDVQDGFVSPESAFEHYGVVLAADGDAVDAAATTARRARLGLLPRGMFHRDGFFDGADFQVRTAAE